MHKRTHILCLLSALSSPSPTDNRYSDVFFILYKQKYQNENDILAIL